MNYTLSIRNTLDNIFAGILIGGIDGELTPSIVEIIKNKKIMQARFNGMFPSNIFQDEYAIFYSIIIDNKIKAFSPDQLELVIDTNKDIILNNEYVDLTKYSLLSNGNQATPDEKLEAVKLDLIDKLKELSVRNIDEVDFVSNCKIFITTFKEQYTLETAQNMTRIMQDTGYDEREKGKKAVHYQGSADVETYYAIRMKKIKELADDETMVRGYVVDSNWLQNEIDNDNKVDDDSILDLGIDEIDSMIGELRRGNMLGVLGPPKGGKTRFSNYIVQRALSKGLNVAVWALEGTPKEWESMQLASYIRSTTGISINSKEILQRKYKDDINKKKYVEQAKIAIATDVKRGRLSFIKGVAYTEDFLDVLQSHYDTENPFDVIVIDSLVNVLSRRGKGKTERISEGYMMLKQFVANKMKIPALAIVPAQLKQEVVDYLRQHPNETIDVTAGGESAETIRTPDEVIGLFSTKTERASYQMKLYSVASRHSGNFEDTTAYCDLQCCYFESNGGLQ